MLQAHRLLEVVEAMGGDEQHVGKVERARHALTLGASAFGAERALEDGERGLAIGGQDLGEGGGVLAGAIEELESF